MIFLIGARASGKTTIGKHLAALLDWDFIDLDAVLLKELGETTDVFVDKNGWEAFRKKESMCLQNVCQNAQPNLVLATGGGVPLAKNNRELMQAHGHIIWLNTPVRELVRRLCADPLHAQRPSLTGKPMLEEVETVCRQREKIYRDCCHVEIESTDSQEEICKDILEKLKLF